MNCVKTSTGTLSQGKSFSQGSKYLEVPSQGHVEIFIIQQLYEQLYALSHQAAQVRGLMLSKSLVYTRSLHLLCLTYRRFTQRERQDTKSTKCLCLTQGLSATTAEIQWLLVSKVLAVEITPKVEGRRVMTP